MLSIRLRHTVLSFSLVVFEKCWVCWPVGSQPAAEWIRLDSPCVWPFVPSLDFGLKSFLLAAPGAVAHSKTSLLGCCWPSVSPRHSSKPLPAGSYLAHEAPQCCVKGRCRHSPFKKWIVGKKTGYNIIVCCFLVVKKQYSTFTFENTDHHVDRATVCCRMLAQQS